MPVSCANDAMIFAGVLEGLGPLLRELFLLRLQGQRMRPEHLTIEQSSSFLLRHKSPLDTVLS
jgi:hypothetical protein